ncbi:hypothetical protein L484_005176 [Morus notabilis]|uniref:Uncharacterized protein n=1 Tax=Morus notabilis TaxID=981085 RepID=W9QJ04_9ROSA|nr:hypothetical protein L484_005176 [Morus notabilis]
MKNEQSRISKNDRKAAKTTRIDANQENIKIIINDTHSRWSPLMDDIELFQQTTAKTTEDFEAFIDEVLYGPKRTTRRLPVFEEICPEYSGELVIDISLQDCQGERVDINVHSTILTN